MRRLLPAILACLLLAGCGAPAETTGTTAENSSEALPRPGGVPLRPCCDDGGADARGGL